MPHLKKRLPAFAAVALAASLAVPASLHVAYALDAEPASVAVESESADANSSQRQDGFRGNSWRYENGSLKDGLESDGAHVLSMTQPPAGAVSQGIDVSSWQGDIDWDAVKAAGIDYAIIRIGWGDQTSGGQDGKWERNVLECERLGIPWGAYLYSYATNTAEASGEADRAIEALRGYSPTLPIYYDLEDSSTASSDHAAIASTFCGKIAAAGYTPGVYANLWWWNNYLTDPVFNTWDRWVAQYNDTVDYVGNFSGWQYTSKGSVPGISGNVDLNWWYGKSLSKPNIYYASVSGAVNEGTLSFKAAGFSEKTSNVAFEVTYPSGTVKWYQGSVQSDGSWSVSVNVNDGTGEVGDYKARAWAAIDGANRIVGMSTASVASSKPRVVAQAESGKLRVSASEWGIRPSNVAFEVKYPSGTVQWVQGVMGTDGSWTADGAANEYGTYRINVWASFGSMPASAVGSADAQLSPGDIKANASVSGGSLNMAARGWEVVPANVAFEVYAPSGASRWYQGQRQSDGSWTSKADIVADLGEWGAYTVNVWATFTSGGTSSLASATVEISAGDPKVSARAVSDKLVASVSGWTMSPANVAFEVYAPSGASRWYQGQRQSDGSWTVSAPATRDFGEWGSYRIVAWATFGPSTASWGSADADFGTVSNSYSIRMTTGLWATGQNGVQASSWDGKAVRGINGLQVRIDSSPWKGGIQYQTFTQGSGWTPIIANGAFAGSNDMSRTLSAVCIAVTGDLANYGDVWYRVYVKDFGWLGWTSNGNISGSTQLALRIDAIQISVQPKGAKAPGSTANAYMSEYPYIGYQNPVGYYQVSNKSVTIPHLGGGYLWISNRISYSVQRDASAACRNHDHACI